MNRFPLILCLGLCCLPSLCLNAQWYKPEKVGKKPAAVYGKALELTQEDKFEEALEGMNEAIRLDSLFVEAYLSQAGIYAALKRYEQSVSNFQKAISLDSIFCQEYYLPYSISLSGIGAFGKALNAVNTFLAIKDLNERSRKAGNYRRDIYRFALNYEKTHDTGFVFSPKNMGDSVNSKDLEYFPSLTIDGKTLVITRRIKNDEDFFECERKPDSSWSKALPLRGMINTELNEGAQNISQDGKWLVFTGCNYPDGAGSCDIYLAYETKKGGWSEPENLGFPVNTEFWESSPSLSPDKRDLYFSSNRPGGYGGKDIWVTHRNEKGKWSKPENLGEEINTDGDESCPFIHADNKTLYFNSNGHEGYGSADIYLSRKNAQGIWNRPENLGFPINTIDEEGSMMVASDGCTGFYASDRGDTKGGLDIYTFKLRKEAIATRTLWVKGKVFDNKTGAGLPSSVELTDINTRRVLYALQTDEDGDYLIPLPEGSDYAFSVNRKGYLFFSENFSLSRQPADSPQTINIGLQPVLPGASIVLKNIFFDINKSTLKAESSSELDKLAILLKDNPKLVVEIGGHTDSEGKDGDNIKLSLDRAQAVTQYLQTAGIDKLRLMSKGYGASKPVASNSTEAGRALNRRTELKVISN